MRRFKKWGDNLNKKEQIAQLRERYEYKNFKTNEPVLDIGGGGGFFLESQGIKEATIIDFTKNKNPKFKYISADITKELPKLKEKFKTIFITEVLEHLKNPLYLLAQVYDFLGEEGVCYISIPYTEIGPEHHHVCRWKKNEILDQTRKLGFDSKIIMSRRRFRGLGFWLPNSWLVLALRTRAKNTNKKNLQAYNGDEELV
ncbi:hypothetical protein CMI41_03205 [Candidatus Pacearchaeota archaeon]|nr:hypothetical protein [Candidatus Pacearchaeota archaeon]